MVFRDEPPPYTDVSSMCASLSKLLAEGMSALQPGRLQKASRALHVFGLPREREASRLEADLR